MTRNNQVPELTISDELRECKELNRRAAKLLRSGITGCIGEGLWSTERDQWLKDVEGE